MYTDVDDVNSGDDVVVIELCAAEVCLPDLLLGKGQYQLKLPSPSVPGMEAAGGVRSAPEESGFRVAGFGVGCARRLCGASGHTGGQRDPAPRNSTTPKRYRCW